jgi:hypothetical protein
MTIPEGMWLSEAIRIVGSQAVYVRCVFFCFVPLTLQGKVLYRSL